MVLNTETPDGGSLAPPEIGDSEKRIERKIDNTVESRVLKLGTN